MRVYYLRLRILHVEDEPRVTRVVGRLLRQAVSSYADVEVRSAQTLQEALQKLRDEPRYDAVLLDLGLPDSDGITTFHQIHGATDLPIVVLTAEPNMTDRAAVVAAGAQDCIYKGELTADVLARSIRFAVERHHHLRELRLALREVEASKQALERLLKKMDVS